jgi:hypothetical protein
MIGFIFADEREAKTFWKKVITKKEAKCEFHETLLIARVPHVKPTQ